MLWETRLKGKGFATLAMLTVLLATPVVAKAASCTSQAELPAQDRDALVAAGGRLAVAVAEQDFATLKAALLPAVASDWQGIHDEVEAAAPLMKGGQVRLNNLYLLDAENLTEPADTQFFCTNASGSLTVAITLKALPPGRYALLLAEATGAPLDGQLGFILAWDDASGAWKLGGLTIRPGAVDGLDGVGWWKRARELAGTDQAGSSEVKPDAWSAWYAYEAARALLLPVDFLSSPNLDKLNTEQAAIPNSPQGAFPLTIADGERNWKIDSVRLDISLLHADLAVAYESTGVTDPAAQRTEAIAVLSAFLKARPGLRQNFHGLWAYAVKDGKQTPVMELPMAQIP